MNDLEDFFKTDFNQEGYVPEKGIRRLKGKESVMIDDKMYWAPEALLNELDRLNGTLKRMEQDTAIMHAIFNCSMSDKEKAGLTYESGPYDITKLTFGIRDFVQTLIKQSRAFEETTEKENG